MQQLTGAELLARLAPLMDERAGVIRSLDKLHFPTGYSGLMHAYSATVARIGLLSPMPGHPMGDGFAVAGYGTGLDETTAKIRAVCEALERYCSMLPPAEGTVVATYRQLGESALDPRRLPQCSARERAAAAPQWRLRVPDADAPEHWVAGYSLTRERPVWVPMSAAYMGLPSPLPDLLAFPLSTGFAAGTSYRQAVLSALCEVIERDSLALWWLHQLPLPRLTAEALRNPDLELLLQRGSRLGLETHLFDLTTSVGVPVIGLIQTTERASPHLTIMAACRTDGLAAAQRVVEEAGSLQIGLTRPEAHLDREAILAGEPVDAEQFGLLYAGPEAPARFAFALNTPHVRGALPPPIEGPDPLAAIVTRMAGLGMEVLAVDVTMPEVRDCGLTVVRVIVPELVPISFSHAIRYLKQPRLYTEPARLGYGVRSEEMVTNDPIPYA